MARRLTPLEEHIAWLRMHGGLRKAIENEWRKNEKDFSQAPIKAFYDARVKTLAMGRKKKGYKKSCR